MVFNTTHCPAGCVLQCSDKLITQYANSSRIFCNRCRTTIRDRNDNLATPTFVWHCDCDGGFDYCVNCAGQRSLCPNKCIMRWTNKFIDQYANSGRIFCDRCQTTIRDQNDDLSPGWHCDCGVDYCESCAGHRCQCPNKCDMKWTNKLIGQYASTSAVSCDKCGASIRQQNDDLGPGWHCDCGIDYCESCALSEPLMLNCDLAPVKQGGEGKIDGGDTGIRPSDLFYCGRKMDQCRCGDCDGRCGPTDGCPCTACLQLVGNVIANKAAADKAAYYQALADANPNNPTAKTMATVGNVITTKMATSQRYRRTKDGFTLAIRQGPELTSAEVGRILIGQELDCFPGVIAIAQGSLRVRLLDGSGWTTLQQADDTICLEAIGPTAPLPVPIPEIGRYFIAQRYTVIQHPGGISLNIRQEPELKSNIIRQIPPGGEVDCLPGVIRIADGSLRVRLLDESGWASYKLADGTSMLDPIDFCSVRWDTDENDDAAHTNANAMPYNYSDQNDSDTEIDNDKDKDTADITTASMIAALASGSGEWNRSKLIVIGEGRSGKSAFVNNFIGLDFEETGSTLGIREFTCSVNHMSQSLEDGSWDLCGKPEHELETALARSMIQRDKQLQQQGARVSKSGTVSITTTESDDFVRSLQASRGLRQASRQLPLGTDGLLKSVSAAQVSSPFAALSVSASTAGSSSVTTQLVQPPSPPVSQISSTSVISPTTAATTTSISASVAVASVVATTEVKADDVNQDILMKCLSSEKRTESGLLLSVFDYGGQEVFDVIHHLFLTAYGVYALCFNMEWLRPSGSETKRVQSLAFLKKWLNSIVLHTHDTKTNKSAPVILIGTHRDKVPDPSDHHEISALLQREFGHHFAWPDILPNSEGQGKYGRENLAFFPVSNVDGRARCPVTRQVIAKIEAAIESSEYTKKKLPLSWLHCMDELNKIKDSFLPMEQVKHIACNLCGVRVDHLIPLLKFMHEMGALLWIDEPGLRDIIIIDAIDYFVKPATLIICNHGCDKGVDDLTTHCLPIHTDCSRFHRSEWKNLTKNGVLVTSLLDTLWRDYIKEKDNLLHMMVRFGLLVPIRDDDRHNIHRFFVPVLLPNVSHSDLLKPAAAWGGDTSKVVRTCYFVFSLDPDLASQITLEAAELKFSGFMPNGLFERLIGRCLQWGSTIAKDGKLNTNEMMLNRDRATMSFGGQSFSIIPHYRLNCIRVESEGLNPLTVTRRLRELCEEVIQECMQSLHLCEAVVFIPETKGDHQHSHSLSAFVESFENDLGGCETTTQLLTLNAIRSAADKSVSIKLGISEILSLPAIREPTTYGCWLESYGVRDCYDVFLSYRWVDYDKKLVNRVFDYLGYYSVGTEHRKIETFQDEKRLQTGRQFDRAFTKALIRSAVIVPVCSAAALRRMTSTEERDANGIIIKKSFDPSVVDNLLLEWLIAVECVKAAAADSNSNCRIRVQFVYPILFGEITTSAKTDHVTISDFFKCGILDALSTCVPVATIAKCKELLLENNITPSIKLDSYTVRSFITNEFLNHLGYKAWEYEFVDHVRQISSGIHAKVADADAELRNAGTGAVAAQSSSHLNLHLPPPCSPVSASGSQSTNRTGILSPVSPLTPGSVSSTSIEDLKKILCKDIWEVITKASKCADPDGMIQYLDEIGVEDVEGVADIATSEEFVLTVCAFLKKAPQSGVRVKFQKLEQLNAML